jgi:cell division protein FtsB
MAERRTPRGAGRVTGRGEGRARGRGPAARPQARTARPRAGRPGPAPRQPRLPRRPRLTGRAAVLVLVLGVLAVSYASSMRAFLDQRERIGELKSAIAEREEAIDDLEREKRRWQDPAFVKTQARQRFGYLMPGETGYQVIDEAGEPLAPSSELSDPDEVMPEPVPTAWWETAWGSVQLAGRPPRRQPRPASRIDAPQEPAGELGGER